MTLPDGTATGVTEARPPLIREKCGRRLSTLVNIGDSGVFGVA
jgi:hypothetical protein